MYISVLYESTNLTSLSQTINSELLKRLSDIEYVQCLGVDRHTIQPCMGCYDCWFKSPGECALSDSIIAKTNAAFVQSDLIFIISPIYYDCYSAPMKALFDHTIANILPFFTTYKNEVHHLHRYKRLADQVIIAYGDDLLPEEKETFIALTKANATNSCIADPKVYFCTHESEVNALLDEIEILIKK